MEIDKQKDPSTSTGKLTKPEVILLLFFCSIGLCFVVISFTQLTPVSTPSSNDNKETDTGGNPTNPVAVLGIPCNSQDACGYHLKCLGPSMKTMTCQCPDNDHQVYLDKVAVGSPRCVGKVGAGCHPKFSSHCVKNANCTRMIPTKNSKTSVKFSEFRCECQPGYAANSRRECDVAFSWPCSSTTPCCQDAGLACREGECKCKNRDDIFEPDRGQCSAPVGGSCKSGIDCVQSASCVYRRNYGWGRCREMKFGENK